MVRPPARGWFRDVLPTPPMSVKYDARSAQAQRVALYWFYFSLGVNLTLPALPIKVSVSTLPAPRALTRVALDDPDG